MSDGSSAADQAKPAGASPLRLRLGVFLILLWWAPFWALSPLIADALGTPGSVATITTIIIVVQTLIGIVGFFVAGAEVKSIVKHTTKRQALRAIWSIFLHGEIRRPDTGQEPAPAPPSGGDA
jgi:hypothetical protein